jgi:hypothetical protein
LCRRGVARSERRRDRRRSCGGLRPISDRKLIRIQIILAGGVAYIPRLSELLSTRFSGATALYSRKVRPDETVVYGAALYARHYFDITPLAFGIEARDGVFTVVLPRNSVLPNSKTRSLVILLSCRSRLMTGGRQI